jgi:inhibitor of cysteine peptidase
MPEVIVTQSDQGRTIEAHQGDLIVVRLAENLTTGYGWEMTPLGSTVLELLDSDYSQDGGELVGRGGTRAFRLHVRSPGTQRVQFEYRRPWEEEAVDHFHVNIEVPDD